MIVPHQQRPPAVRRLASLLARACGIAAAALLRGAPAATAAEPPNQNDVTTVRRVPTAALPTGIWSLRGRARLVLVTCGGPFDAAAGRYIDNVVVTAVPV